METHPFRAAVEARDHAALVHTLAPDVVFHSPVRFQPFEGRDDVGLVLAAVLETLEDFRYTDELSGSEALALVFQARVGDRELQGLDLLGLNEEGLVSNLTVMVRPLSALNALADAMGRRLAATAGESRT